MSNMSFDFLYGDEQSIPYNKVSLSGTVRDLKKLRYRVFNIFTKKMEDVYSFNMEIRKKSSADSDLIPVLVSKDICISSANGILGIDDIRDGMPLTINGYAYAHTVFNTALNKKTLTLYVRTYEADIPYEGHYFQNNIIVRGRIKKLYYYKTSRLRRITGVVTIKEGDREYRIPFYVKGNYIDEFAKYKEGDSVRLLGRLRNREYPDTTPEGSVYMRTVYEIYVYAFQKDN